MTSISLDPHPLADLVAFTAELPKPLSELASPPSLLELFKPGAKAPLTADDAVRSAVRDLLRHGGFKPTGRSKPASEYLVRASAEGQLSSINLLVDACNAVSLHSGLPISVVDLERTMPPLRVGLGAAGQGYVFNASGQVIDVEGLLCLFDAEGPCANAVKDAQRTKTHPGTTKALAILWGTKALAGRAAEAARWYRALLSEAGIATADVSVG